ncbi:MAG: 3-dehydroquinate synthase [Oscillospiraceae bacterium]|nr:3-dehydroquinate synthase [Oscillospiraceae bacterium]
MEYKRISVSASGSYEIVIGNDLLGKTADYVKSVAKTQTFAVITDDTVDSFYGEKVCQSLSAAGCNICKYVFPHGEESKCSDTLMKIYSFLCQNHISRTDCLIALGGGVVGDITGYAAATFLRGLDFIQIPTTLLAQVDSSVGGKTAIDIPEGKNLVGAFKQPRLVLCDTDTLNTLPEEFIIDGMGEVVKYGMIKSAPLFELLETRTLGDIKEIAESIIEQCVSIKRDVVEADEFDKGERMLLNFGHTLAHSIEQYYNYTGITHGKAVAAGMRMITDIAEKKGYSESGLCDRLTACLERYKLNVRVEPTVPQLANACLNDKKRTSGSISIVICSEVGKSRTVKMPVDDFLKFLTEE